ncbi:hypothetical protein TWF569_002247 [Orbilia oligospora]|uniref:Thiaminase-2/PQQC domain-containing protein n=1 Tax=Orbilia oligospora TaxID=2813651 RepID=A0A7C8NKM5_ORBOL|nr:hypothetical protein TWF706_002316 [Orbilia oligospora]KAF3122162.1 hypothetical protein TWF569_002247 [Orbilia oligospora]KAF3127800.1 hypothetical protein TWF703_009848 [Orbilia oligospora]
MTSTVNSNTNNITTHLLTLCPTAYKSATEHPFLTAAATNTLPTPLLLQWLLQDRHYALTYISFIGALLSKLTIPTTSNRLSTLSWKIANTLIFSLNNIKAELALFDKVLMEEFGWTEGGEVEVLPITRAYQDMFAGAGSGKASLLEGMVVLWATERCYFDAWGFAKRSSGGDKSSTTGEEKERKSDVMTRIFIPNWTSEEFEGFVDTLEELVNGIVKDEGVEVGSEVWGRCEATWRQVLWLEEGFWPDV